MQLIIVSYIPQVLKNLLRLYGAHFSSERIAITVCLSPSPFHVISRPQIICKNLPISQVRLQNVNNTIQVRRDTQTARDTTELRCN